MSGFVKLIRVLAFTILSINSANFNNVDQANPVDQFNHADQVAKANQVKQGSQLNLIDHVALTDKHSIDICTTWLTMRAYSGLEQM